MGKANPSRYQKSYWESKKGITKKQTEPLLTQNKLRKEREKNKKKKAIITRELLIKINNNKLLILW